MCGKTDRSVHSTEQREADEAAIRHPSHDVRLGAEAREVHQHEWTHGRPHEGLQVSSVHERLD